MDSPNLVDLKVSQPDQAVFKSASNALAMAKAYEIDSADVRDMAAGELIKIVTLKKSVESQRKAITIPIDNAKKAVMDLFRAPTDYLEQAEAILKGSIQKFDRAEQQRRIAEQARLEELARQERARLEQEAAARDAAAREEAAKIRRAADEAAAAGRAEDAARLASEASSRVEQGAAEVMMLQQTSQLVTAPVTAAPRKTAGVSTRMVWKAEISDKLALIRYVAEHPEYVDLLEANMPAVNKIALALKANCPLAGVRVFEDAVIAARAA
jgi:DNA gyrase/topoisomerase IV subunit A